MDVEIADEYKTFAKVIRTSTTAGLVMLVLSSVMYLLDFDPLVEPERVVETWHLSASEFWKVNIGKEIKSYSEFLYIEHPDTIAVFSTLYPRSDNSYSTPCRASKAENVLQSTHCDRDF